MSCFFCNCRALPSTCAPFSQERLPQLKRNQELDPVWLVPHQGSYENCLDRTASSCQDTLCRRVGLSLRNHDMRTQEDNTNPRDKRATGRTRLHWRSAPRDDAHVTSALQKNATLMPKHFKTTNDHVNRKWRSSYATGQKHEKFAMQGHS